MDTPRDHRESTGKQDFLYLFSAHLNSESRNGAYAVSIRLVQVYLQETLNLRNLHPPVIVSECENTSIDDSSSCTNKLASQTNNTDISSSTERKDFTSDASVAKSTLQDRASDIFSIEDDGKALQNLIPVNRPSTTNKNGRANVSLVVGDLSRIGPLAEMIARQTVAHRLQVCRDEDAYMFCNKEAYSIIWILVILPANQDLLSLTTSIRYFSKFNKETAVIGISSTRGDVDLSLHGIDEIVVQPINKFIVQQEYKKWTLVKVNPDELTKENPLQRNLFSGFPVSRPMSFSQLSVSVKSAVPLYGASKQPPTHNNTRKIQEKNSLSSNQSSSNINQRDHTAKEKLRRERIKESCDQLRVLLPYIRGRKTDMASILEMCVDYLKMINTLLPIETRLQIMELLCKDVGIFGQTANNPAGSIFHSQSNSRNLPNSNTKSTMPYSQILSPSNSNKASCLESGNDPGCPNLLKEINVSKSMENAKSDSVVTEEEMKDSNLQCCKHKRPRLNEHQSLDDYLPNPRERPNYTHSDNNPLISSLLSTNQHNTEPLVATDLRKDSNLIHPGQLAPDTARNHCSRILMTKTSESIPMNTGMSMLNCVRTCPSKPPQQAQCQLQQDNMMLNCKTKPLLSSQQSSHYPTGLTSFDDGKRNSMYTSSAQARYKPDCILRTITHLPISQQPKTTASTNPQSLPLMDVVVGSNTTVSRIQTLTSHWPESTHGQLARDIVEKIT